MIGFARPSGACFEQPKPAVWLPAIRAGTGADVFTERLAKGLGELGVRAEITWLPLRAEYAPWTVVAPRPPAWANVVHINTWLHRRFLPACLPIVATVHHCVHEPGMAPYKSVPQAAYHRHWVLPLERVALSRAHGVVAVSEYTARRTREIFATKDIRVIHNGVPAPLHIVAPRTPARAGPFRLLYVGSWSRRKGSDLLSPIMRALGEEFELHYAGAGADVADARTLPSNCHMAGRPDDFQLDLLYRNSDALLLPTRLEGFGQVAVEAMARGTPVIATRGSAIPEVVQDDVSGILCRQDDINAFANAARRLAGDAEGWFRLSAGALKQAERFSISAMSQAYRSVYSEIIREHAGRTSGMGADE